MTIRESWLIQGMSCPGCENAIHRALSQLKGVRRADASLSDASLTLEYDPAEITLDDVRRTVEKLGYKIVDKNPPGNKKQNDPVG